MTDTRPSFEVFDSDGDGFLTTEEVGHVLRAQGYNPSEKQVTELCSELPTPHRVSLADFSRLTLKCPKPPSPAQYASELCEAFRVFDRDENGLIGENELHVILTTLGETLNSDSISALMQQLKVDNQGKVKYADFVQLILAP